VNSLDPGLVQTDGLRASGLSEGAFREQQERERLWGESLDPTTLLQRQLSLQATMLAGSPAKRL
jgi:hypothetical protein